MLQRTEKGKARRYFIECEKQAKNTLGIKSEMALLIENALKLDNERMKPRSEFVDMVFNTTANDWRSKQKY
jgi:hypothetical protein